MEAQVIGSSISLEFPLNECKRGDELEVMEVVSESAVGARLRELGMVPGACLGIVRDGSPMIIQLGNTRFCLRGNEAAMVKVRLITPVDLSEPAIPAQSPS